MADNLKLNNMKVKVNSMTAENNLLKIKVEELNGIIESKTTKHAKDMHSLQELYSKERKEFRDEYNIIRTEIEELNLKVSARDIELAEERSLTNKLKAKLKSLEKM